MKPKQSELDELIENLSDRMLEHDVVYERAVVILAANEVQEIIEHLERLKGLMK